MVNLQNLMANIMKNNAIVAQKDAVCPKHGVYQANVTANHRVSPCPACATEKAQRALEKQAEKEHQRLFEKIGKCGIPKRHQACSVRNYQASSEKQKSLKRAIAAYVQQLMQGGLKRNFVMLGNCGTGKTHLACAVGMAALKQGKTVLFLTASEIIRRIQAAHKSTSESEWELMNMFAQIDLLIIDEVGVQYASESANRIITEIVNARYGHEKPTIFISNLSPAEFKQTLGERAMSRMQEDGCEPFVCDWADYRTQCPNQPLHQSHHGRFYGA